MLPILRNGTALVPATTSAGPANRIASLFDRFFNDEFLAPAAPQAWTTMPLSLWDDEHTIYVELDTPGLTDRDIELSVHDGKLYIRGERKCEHKEGRYDTRSYGQFEQCVSLPAAVDTDRVEAKLANGVLQVTLPKSPEAKPRKITIKSA